MGQSLIVHGVRAYARQELPGDVQFSLSHVGVDRAGQRRDIGDGDDPLVSVEMCGFAGEAELQRSVAKRLEAEVTFGVPLHPGGSLPQLALPRGTIGVESVLVVGQAGVPQCPLETLPGDLDGEDALLAFLAAPSAAATGTTA